MAGQGFRKVRECLKTHGAAFRERPRTIAGMATCRSCGYRIDLHEQLDADDPTLRALASAPPRETSLTAEQETARRRGLAEVAAGTFATPTKTEPAD
jgi:hypothetical protein